LAKDGEGVFWSVLRLRGAEEPGSSAIVREDGFEVALKNEGSLSVDEERSAILRDPAQRLTDERGMLPKVLRHHRGSSRRSGVVPRVCKADEALEENFELEEMLELAVHLEMRQPRLTCEGLFPAKTTRLA